MPITKTKKTIITRRASSAASEIMRKNYERFGVRGYYSEHADGYHNPHEMEISLLVKRNIDRIPHGKILDLACGSGEVTLALLEEGITTIDAIDPYTSKAYESRTGRLCESISFEDVMLGALRGRKYSCVICSFAMHLVEESKLPKLISELSKATDTIAIITPHKRPDLSKFLRKTHEDFVLTQKGKRVRMILYSSN